MSSWKFLDIGWKRIGGVFAAITVLSTFTINMTGWDIVKVSGSYGLLGIAILVSGWMLDKHTKEFEIINNQRDERLIERDKELQKRVEHIEEALQVIKKHSLETHKDTVRIQLLQLLQHQPDNVDTILTIAEKYFCELKGDWFMTNVFMDWCKKHDIDPKIALSCKVEEHK